MKSVVQRKFPLKGCTLQVGVWICVNLVLPNSSSYAVDVA